jgi:hypothetical protein
VSTELRVSLKKGVHQALDDFQWLVICNLAPRA